MKNALLIIIGTVFILGIFVPILPFPVKNGYHGANGEFCGIAYNEACDKMTIRLMKWVDIKEYLFPRK